MWLSSSFEYLEEGTLLEPNSSVDLNVILYQKHCILETFLTIRTLKYPNYYIYVERTSAMYSYLHFWLENSHLHQ